MKILQVGSGLDSWGGIERQLLYLSNGLTQRGHEVVVSCAPGSPLFNRIPVAKVPIQVTGRFDLRALSQYLKHFRSNRYDVVHIHFSLDFSVPGIAARLTKQPLSVMTRHLVLPWPKFKVKLYSALFDHIMPVSNASRLRLMASGIRDEKMTVVNPGCPPLVATRSREEMRRDLDIAPDQFAIGFVGRLVKEKGVETLIAACASLPVGCRVEVFGSGPHLSELERQVASESAPVRFRGFREDVPDCMNAMDVIAVPSVWDEAFPASAFEAMSLGRAVVASRVGGIPEVVEDAKTGLLFERGDVAGLSDAIRKLEADPSLRDHLGRAGRHKHQTQYTLEKMSENIESVFVAQSRH